MNLSILGIQGAILREYMSTTRQFINFMKMYHRHEYLNHRMNEICLFVAITVSFVALDLMNLAIYAFDVINLMCIYSGIEFSYCTDLQPSLSCYYKLTPVSCLSYALPAILFVLIYKPHDCFHCLSICPDSVRISNFQLTLDEQRKRDDPMGSQRGSGGAFSGFKLDRRDPSKMAEEKILIAMDSEINSSILGLNRDNSYDRSLSHEQPKSPCTEFSGTLSVDESKFVN